MEELYLDVSAEWQRLRQTELCKRVCPLHVLVDLGRVDLCLVQPY